MNRELANLMYELYDREFDIDETEEVISSLTDLRRANQNKNRMILKYGEDSEKANLWREEERGRYKFCEIVFNKYDLNYKPYSII